MNNEEIDQLRDELREDIKELNFMDLSQPAIAYRAICLLGDVLEKVLQAMKPCEHVIELRTAGANQPATGHCTKCGLKFLVAHWKTEEVK